MGQPTVPVLEDAPEEEMIRSDNTPTMIDAEDLSVEMEEPKRPEGEKERLIAYCDGVKFSLLRCTKKLTDNPNSSLVEIQECNDVAQTFDHCARKIRTLYDDVDPHISEEDWKQVNEELENNKYASSIGM